MKVLKNTIWIIVSALIGLLSPTYCGAENIAPGKSQVDTLSHKSRQIITIQVGSYKKVEDAERDMTRLNGLGLDAFKDYERVKVLLGTGLNLTEISQAIGRGLPTVQQYHQLVLTFHPELNDEVQEGS